MSLTTKTNVLTIAPHLSTASDDLWDLYLVDVNNSLSSSVFGTKTEEAARNWVAHYMTISTSSDTHNVSGPVTKHKVGDVMKEYVNIKNLSAEEADYGRTKYGKRFLTIRRSVLINFRVVVPGV